MTHIDSHTPLKVTLLCHSDMIGGASVVTFRLMNALRREGVDARMLVFTKSSDSDNICQVSTRGVRGLKFMLERIRIFASNSFDRKNLFKVSVANTGVNLSRHPWVKDADILLISWINQGMLSLKGIRHLASLGKPVIWTMHDMWCMTGICHHAYECTRYREQCGRCPFLHSHIKNDLSHRVWHRKDKLYNRTDLVFVAVSRWLAEKAAESSLLSNRDIRVIPNAFPVESFLVAPTHTISTFSINHASKLIVMGAARLDDPIKGLDLAIDALNYIFDNYPDKASKATIIFFGNLRERQKLDRLRFSCKYLGRINDWRMLRQLYASADVVLSSSLYETLPGTLIEGQAAGCLPVSFDRGGQSDIITEHKVNGYIAHYPDTVDLAEGIMWALDQNRDRNALHRSVEERFASRNIALQYIDLFNELLGRNSEEK